MIILVVTSQHPGQGDNPTIKITRVERTCSWLYNGDIFLLKIGIFQPAMLDLPPDVFVVFVFFLVVQRLFFFFNTFVWCQSKMGWLFEVIGFSWWWPMILILSSQKIWTEFLYRSFVHKGGPAGCMKQKVCWVEKLKKIIESKSLVSHTFNWAYFCQKRLFLPQSRQGPGRWVSPKWSFSTSSLEKQYIILYEHVPSEYVPSSYPLLLQNWCLLGIVRKIDNFTAEAYSHLSHHKGSKVLGGAATIPGGRSDMIVSGNWSIS